MELDGFEPRTSRMQLHKGIFTGLGIAVMLVVLVEIVWAINRNSRQYKNAMNARMVQQCQQDFAKAHTAFDSLMLGRANRVEYRWRLETPENPTWKYCDPLGTR